MKRRTQPAFIEGSDNLNLLKKHQRQIWFKLVEKAGDFKSIGEMTKRYQPNNKYIYEAASGGTVRSTNFNKYRNGKTSPGKRTLERIKRDFPRAEYWLNQPLWEILKGPMTLNRADELLRESRLDFLARLYKTNPLTGQRERRKIKTESFVDKLVIDGTFEALNILVLLMVEDEHYKYAFNQLGRKKLMCLAALELIRNICLFSTHKEHFDWLFQVISARFYYYWESDLAKEKLFMELDVPPKYNLNGANILLNFSRKIIEGLEENLNLTVEDRKKLNKLILGFDKLPTKEKRSQMIQEIKNLHLTGISQNKTPVFAKIISDTLKIDV